MKESILNHYIKERMKISIIVPVYNVEQYIKECFDSIGTIVPDRFPPYPFRQNITWNFAKV